MMVPCEGLCPVGQAQQGLPWGWGGVGRVAWLASGSTVIQKGGVDVAREGEVLGQGGVERFLVLGGDVWVEEWGHLAC